MSDIGAPLTVKFEVIEGDAIDGLAEAIRNEGAEATLERPPGLLPLVAILAIVIPPGVALLAEVVNRIVHSWKDNGSIIDARGEGPPLIKRADDLPHGTVVILTRDGDEAVRNDLSSEKLSDYISAAIKAVVGGVSASSADATAAA